MQIGTKSHDCQVELHNSRSHADSAQPGNQMHLSISIQPMCYTVELHAMLYSEASHSGTLITAVKGAILAC